MTSTPDVTPDIPRTQDASSTSPPYRHASTGAVSSSKNRYSIGSNETGESSRRSVASSSGSLVERMAADRDDGAEAASAHTNGRGGYRSHRNRNSGGFLLSSSAFDTPSKVAGDAVRTPHRRQPSREEKGKTSVQSREKGQTKRRSNTGLGLGVRSSPLASTVTTAETEDGVERHDSHNDGDKKSEEPQAAGFDVDSTQIVNLALNLSESRRAAARRSVSATTPPVSSGFRDSFAGGSLRQHLQQQRRTSRNPSPKAGRNERALSGSYKTVPGQKPHSPLNTPFDPDDDEDYRYRFSPSTLARADKAKNYIGLMIEYRRLLQYVPPLKSNGTEKGGPFDSPLSSRLTSPHTEDTASDTILPLGREYNPLQYIRNRKVRARERKAIDGEVQGFGDLTKVSSWVHEVAATVLASQECRTTDSFPMPPFSKAAEVAASPHTPPQSKSQTTTPRIKRPRIDWVTNPADLLADVFWLEQDENKTIIEDHSGRKIFAGAMDLKRPVSNREEVLEQQKSAELARPGSPSLRIDTKLPEFNHSRSDSAKQRERATSRAKQKLREVTRLHHGHNGSGRERPLFKGRLLSETDSSDTDGAHRPRRRSRRQATESLDPSTDILDKQMMEMLAKESTEQEWAEAHGRTGNKLPISQDGSLLSPDGSRTHTRSTSLATNALPNQSSILQTASGRPSIEGPLGNPRTSFEELDSTAPNSPQTKATIAASAFVPSIAMDLTPPLHAMSPSRHHISRVTSRINPFHEHSRNRSRGRGDTTEALVSAPSLTSNQIGENPDESDLIKLSSSPIAKVSTRKTDESAKAIGKTNLRRGRGGDEPSSIIGFLKGSRGPVAKVGELLWKKEPARTLSVPPGFSSDESDSEILRAMREVADPPAGETSTDPAGVDSLGEKPSLSRSGKLPVFTSLHNSRGRLTTDENGDAAADSVSERKPREERIKSAPNNYLEIPPRVDARNPSPSPSLEGAPMRRYSSVSDLESRRGSALSGVESADARLNAILGQPGHPGTYLPVTGLSSLEVTHQKRPALEDKREWSISDCEIPGHRGPVTKKEIARVRALLFTSGIKAKEISRQAAEIVDLRNAQKSPFADIAKISKENPPPVPNSQQHILAARILANDMQLSSQAWQASADSFYDTTVSRLFDRADKLHSSIADGLAPRVRTAADEADAVSRDILTFQSLQVKRIIDTMDNMMRRRRRRFRWLRRGGWVLVEWSLVGVMWFAWFLVVFVRIILGLGTGVVRSVRWLFWL